MAVTGLEYGLQFGLFFGQGIEIGIIAVPASAARAVALALISAGVRALLNLTATHLNVPDYVTVVHARIVHSLEELSCAMKMRQ